MKFSPRPSHFMLLKLMVGKLWVEDEDEGFAPGSSLSQSVFYKIN